MASSSTSTSSTTASSHVPQATGIGNGSCSTTNTPTTTALPGAALGVALERLAQCLTPTAQAWARRQELVDEHLLRLQKSWRSSHPIRILPFGSTLSGLCLADSDIDLGLFGAMHGCELEALTGQQAKKLLYSVLGSLQRARLPEGKVQTVMGARVPVLKYTCSLSGLDCDISIQGTGALVKANLIRILHKHCPALSPLYRLVKCWAAAHDLNDASRSTFNSTSLLYLTIFYLQLRQLVPPIKDVVDTQQLNDTTHHLLHPTNKRLWNQQQHLDELLAAAETRAAAWAEQQRGLHGSSWEQPDLGDLLQGFFALYADLMTDWVLGRQREAYADLWAGQLTSERLQHERLGKDYLFNLQDPFDPVDCPARAIGTLQKTNNGVGVLIVYLVTCSNMAMKRYMDASSSSDGSDSSAGSLRQRLCQCLAWLFGPQGVLLMEPPRADLFDDPRDECASSTCAAAAAAAAAAVAGSAAGGAVDADTNWQSWAVCPFGEQLCSQLRQQMSMRQARSQQDGKRGRNGRSQAPMTPAALFRWLVNQLQAALEPDKGPSVLCLEHLQALNKRIESGLLQGALGAALAAGAAERRAEQQQHRHHLEETRREWQQQRLPGPPLPQEDAHIRQLSHGLQVFLSHQRWQPRPDGKRRNPDSHSKVVKDAVRETITQVARRMCALAVSSTPQVQQQVQQQEQPLSAHHTHVKVSALSGQEGAEGVVHAWETAWHGAPSDTNGSAAAQASTQTAATAAAGDAPGIGGHGLLAVLQQHGFMDILEQWGFVEAGAVWTKLLPFPEHLLQQADGGAAPAAAEPPPARAPAPAPAPAKPSLPEQQAQAGQNAEAAATAMAALAAAHGGSSKHARAPVAGVQSSTASSKQSGRKQQQQQQRVELEVDVEVQTSTVRHSGAVRGSVVTVDVQESLQQLSVGVGIVQVAGGSSRGPAAEQQQQQQQQPPQQHKASSRQQKQHTSRHVEQQGSRQHQALDKGVLDKRVPAQHQQQQPPHHQQQHHRQLHSAAPAYQPAAVRVVPRPKRGAQEVCLPDDPFECNGVQPFATHGDGLAESYCRQLQEKLSSPPPPKHHMPQSRLQQQQQQVPPQGRRGSNAQHQAQQLEPRHPAAELLSRSPASSALAAGRVSSSTAPASSSAAAGRVQQQQQQASSSSSSSAAKRLQKAKYKVEQLQAQQAQAEKKIAPRQQELQHWRGQVQQLMASAGPGGEQALSHDDRQQLLEAKQGVRSAEMALKMMTTNLQVARSKLPAALQELSEIQAVVAANTQPQGSGGGAAAAAHTRVQR